MIKFKINHHKKMYEQEGSPCFICLITSTCQKNLFDKSACDKYKEYIRFLIRLNSMSKRR